MHNHEYRLEDEGKRHRCERHDMNALPEMESTMDLKDFLTKCIGSNFTEEGVGKEGRERELMH